MSQVKLIFQHLKSLLSTSKSISIVTLVVAVIIIKTKVIRLFIFFKYYFIRKYCKYKKDCKY